jgi:hypothetical protein
VQELPLLPDVVESLHESHAWKNICPSFHKLSEVLSFIADSYSRVFFIVDALDECTNTRSVRELFLQKIFQLQNQKKISLFATSRKVEDITEMFEGKVSLEIRASDEDVQRYLDERIPQLLRSSISKYVELQDTIRTDILKAVDGMYIHPSIDL